MNDNEKIKSILKFIILPIIAIIALILAFIFGIEYVGNGHGKNQNSITDQENTIIIDDSNAPMVIFDTADEVNILRISLKEDKPKPSTTPTPSIKPTPTPTTSPTPTPKPTEKPSQKEEYYTYTVQYRSETGKILRDDVQIKQKEGTTKTYVPQSFEGYITPDQFTMNFTKDKTITLIYDLIKYQVKIDLDCGKLDTFPQLSYDIEHSLSFDQIPTKKNYDFIGYERNNQTDRKIYIPIGSTGDREYKAKYELQSKTLYFNANGGSTTESSRKIKIGNKLGTLPTAIKYGYNFNGWYSMPEDGVKITADHTMPEVDVTVHAQYTPKNIPINIEYISNSTKKTILTDSTSGEFDTKITYKTLIEELKKKGYKPREDNIEIKIDKEKIDTIYVICDPIDYSITYELNNGIVNKNNPTTYNVETPTFTLNNPTKEGYNFLGWSGTGLANVTDNVTIKTGSMGDRRYKANFKIKSYTVDVIFVKENSKEVIYKTTKTGDHGTSTTVLTPMDLLEEIGYTTDTTEVNIEFYENGEKEIIVECKPIIYNITYKGIEDCIFENENPITYTIEDTVVIHNPTKEGYEFTGWTTEGIDEPTKNMYINKGSKGDRIFTAHFTQNMYTLTLDFNDEVTPNQTVKLKPGDKYGELPTPERYGYNFEGWYESKEGGQEATSETVMGNEDTTIYAYWSPIEYVYEIRYITDANEILGNTSIKGTLGMKIEHNPPSYDGYITPANKMIVFDQPTKTIDFIYIPIEYLIRYELNGGTDPYNPTTYTVKDNDIVLNNPTKEGYEFVGWTGSNGSLPETTVVIQSGSTGNKEYTANWNEPIVSTTYLARGPIVNFAINKDTKLIEFVDYLPPEGTKTKDVSNAQDNSILAWYDDTAKTTYIGSDANIIIANEDMNIAFAQLSQLETIHFNDILDTSITTDMSNMFSGTGKSVNNLNLDLSDFNTSSVVNMSNMFESAGANAQTVEIDLHNWDTSKVTNMMSMFSGTGMNSALINIKGLENLNLKAVENTSWMFAQFANAANAVNIGNIGQWNVSGVTDMSFMFMNAATKVKAFEIDLSNWNVSNVTNMAHMFDQFGQSLENWSVGNLGNWQPSNNTDASYMFANAGIYSNTFNIGNIGQWNTSNISNMASMFSWTAMNATEWNIGDLSGWNTSKVTDMSNMFMTTGRQDKNWSIGNIGQWDVSSVINMSGMFYQAANGKEDPFTFDLNGWNTSKVTDMSAMFFSFGGFTDANILFENWDTSSVINMKEMFKNSHISNLNLSNWVFREDLNSTNMFYGMADLTGGIAKDCETANKLNELLGKKIFTIKEGSCEVSTLSDQLENNENDGKDSVVEDISNSDPTTSPTPIQTIEPTIEPSIDTIESEQITEPIETPIIEISDDQIIEESIAPTEDLIEVDLTDQLNTMTLE